MSSNRFAVHVRVWHGEQASRDAEDVVRSLKLGHRSDGLLMGIPPMNAGLFYPPRGPYN